MPSPDQPAKRRCLGLNCGKLFKSRDASHRICPKCERTRRDQHTPRVTSDTVYDGGARYNISQDST
jgi:hypothetical protein